MNVKNYSILCAVIEMELGHSESQLHQLWGQCRRDWSFQVQQEAQLSLCGKKNTQALGKADENNKVKAASTLWLGNLYILTQRK